MGKLAATSCETAKPDPKRDRLLGDGDGLFLRVRPHGTKTWVIEYEFQGKRTKYTIGGYARDGAPGNSIPDWLRFGQQSLTQSRSIAGNWKAARRANTIRRRLGWEAGIANPEGVKPKGIHWRTFERLKAEHDAFANASMAGMMRKFGRLGWGIDDLLDDR